LRQHIPPPPPRHQHGRGPSVEYNECRWVTFVGTYTHWTIAVDANASVLTDEVILDIGFNCDASSILTFSSSSVSKYISGMSYQQLQMVE